MVIPWPKWRLPITANYLKLRFCYWNQSKVLGVTKTSLKFWRSQSWTYIDIYKVILFYIFGDISISLERTHAILTTSLLNRHLFLSWQQQNWKRYPVMDWSIPHFYVLSLWHLYIRFMLTLKGLEFIHISNTGK